MVDEFENVPFKNIYEYIMSLVKKRKSLQHYQKVVLARSWLKQTTNGIEADVPIDVHDNDNDYKRKIIHQSQKIKSIDEQIMQIEMELKSYDHRYEGEPGTQKKYG